MAPKKREVSFWTTVAKTSAVSTKDVKAAVASYWREAINRTMKAPSHEFNLNGMLMLKVRIRRSERLRRFVNPNTGQTRVLPARPSTKAVIAIPLKKMKAMVASRALDLAEVVVAD